MSESTPPVPPRSSTEVRGFKNCRREWDYFSRQKLTTKQSDTSHRWFGTTIHECLGRYYLYQENPVDVFRELTLGDPAAENWYDLGISMMERYLDWAPTVDRFDRVLGAELQLFANLPNGEKISGRVDLLVEQQGRLWVVDHKTYQTFVDDSDLETDDQLMTYLYLVSQNYPDIPVGGAFYNQLRKRIPAEPSINKNGSVSKVAIDTTYEIYYNAIIAQGCDPSDYQDQLNKLRGQEFFRRSVVVRDQAAQDAFVEELQAIVYSMNHDPIIYPNRTTYCRICDFANLCRIQSLGQDIDPVKQAFYTTWEER